MSNPLSSSTDIDLDKDEQGLATRMTPLRGSELLDFLDIQFPSAEQQLAASNSAQHGFQQPRSEDNTQLVFTAFAAEIRQEIYTQLFASSNLRPLRRLGDLRDLRSSNNPPHVPNDILRTKQMIYTEALPNFYRSYIFHVNLDPQILTSPRDIKQHQLEHIRHISLGTNFAFDKKGGADSAMALSSIMTNCHRLKTLILHFFTTLEGSQPQPSEEWAAKTAPVLRSLHPRLERLTFVAAEPNTYITSLRVAIAADRESWEIENRETYWPMITLLDRQSKKNMLLRYEQEYGSQFPLRKNPNGCVIHSFHLYRKYLAKQTQEEAT